MSVVTPPRSDETAEVGVTVRSSASDSPLAIIPQRLHNYFCCQSAETRDRFIEMHFQFVGAVLIRTLMKIALGKRSLKRGGNQGQDPGVTRELMLQSHL